MGASLEEPRPVAPALDGALHFRHPEATVRVFFRSASRSVRPDHQSGRHRPSHRCSLRAGRNRSSKDIDILIIGNGIKFAEAAGKMLHTKVSVFKNLHKENTKRIKKLIDEIAEKEANILELETKVVKYERGNLELNIKCRLVWLRRITQRN